MDMIEYVRNFGDLTFKNKPMNEVDMLIFSQLSYLINEEIVFEEGEKIQICKLIERVNLTPQRSVIAQTNALELLKELHNTLRFGNIEITAVKYEYKENLQFGAMCFKLDGFTKVISYEGTDATIEGWKEDLTLSYMYPNQSHICAIEFLEDVVRPFDRNIYLCGHSKGGNLALVAAMNTTSKIKKKIKKIYNFDGPGLKKEQFFSSDYLDIRDKLVNIIPEGSFVGILLESEKQNVIASDGVAVMQHGAHTWKCGSDELIRTEQRQVSKNLKVSIDNWINSYTNDQIEEIVNGIFEVFNTIGYAWVGDYVTDKKQTIQDIIRTKKELSPETKQVVQDAIKLLIIEAKDNFSADAIEKLKGKIDAFKSTVREGTAVVGEKIQESKVTISKKLEKGKKERKNKKQK